MVTKIALRIAKKLWSKGYIIDMKLVESGGLLHDIGRSVTHGIEHGAIGGQIARKLGLDNAIVQIIERHVGAGLTREEARKNKLPEGSYVPETLEEKVVCYADKLTEGDHEADIETELEKLRQELGANHSAVKRLQKLDAEITGMLK
jgi:uncharacterized protein